MNNPYNCNQPAATQVFVGRGLLVERIADDLSSPYRADSWAIIGGRHFGKASILKALHARLMRDFENTDTLTRRVFPVSIHLTSCDTQSERNIFRCVLREIHKKLYQRSEPLRAPADLLAGIITHSEECTFFEFEEVLDRMIRELERVCGPVRLVLLLHDVEKMMRYSWRDILFDKLRALVHDSDLSDKIKLVLTGSTHVAQAHASGSPLLQSVNIEHLSALSNADMEDLIAPGGGATVEALAAIKEQSGGHPFIAQFLLSKLWDAGLQNVTGSQVETVARQMRQERVAVLQSWWEDIGDMGQRAYTLLCGSEEWHHERDLLARINDPLLPLDQALGALCYHGMAIRDESGQRYKAVGLLFRSWVTQNKQVVEVDSRSAGVTQLGESKNITWLHLSDIHFKEGQNYDSEIVLKSLLKAIPKCVEEDNLHLDFAVLTGDLAFSGKTTEYALVRRFLDELLAATGLTKEQLFVVPGNHDVDRKLVTTGATAINLSLNGREAVNNVLASASDRRLLMERLKGYSEFVNAYLPHLAFDDENYFYVRMLDINGKRVALLGLNSAWLAESNEDEARRLVIGERQMRALIEGAEKGDAHLKIALLHHPLSLMREFEQNDSVSLLIDNCDFILHGHLHQLAVTNLTSPDSNAMIITGGACYTTRRYPNSVNFVRLNLTANSGIVFFWRYVDAHGGFWVRDNSLYVNVPNGIHEFQLASRLSQRLSVDRGVKGALLSTQGQSMG
jgi:predicted MPP superfamily phosphohydrolase